MTQERQLSEHDHILNSNEFIRIADLGKDDDRILFSIKRLDSLNLPLIAPLELTPDHHEPQASYFQDQDNEFKYFLEKIHCLSILYPQHEFIQSYYHKISGYFLKYPHNYDIHLLPIFSHFLKDISSCFHYQLGANFLSFHQILPHPLVQQKLDVLNDLKLLKRHFPQLKDDQNLIEQITYTMTSLPQYNTDEENIDLDWPGFDPFVKKIGASIYQEGLNDCYQLQLRSLHEQIACDLLSLFVEHPSYFLEEDKQSLLFIHFASLIPKHVLLAHHLRFNAEHIYVLSSLNNQARQSHFALYRRDTFDVSSLNDNTQFLYKQIAIKGEFFDPLFSSSYKTLSQHWSVRLAAMKPSHQSEKEFNSISLFVEELIRVNFHHSLKQSVTETNYHQDKVIHQPKI